MPATKKNYKLNLINMDTKIKNYLGAGAVISMVMLAISSLIFAGIYAKSVEPSSYRNFSVSGEGKITAVPDVAQFSFSVITEGGKNIAELQKENSQKANGAINFLKQNGAQDKDIKTTNYNLQPRYQHFDCSSIRLGTERNKPCPPPEIVGYSVNQTVSVKVRDFNKISDLLAGTVQSGANAVSELSFIIDDKTALENKARQEAIENAMKKAESMAQAGRFNLGKILSINEEEGGMPRFSIREKLFSNGAGRADTAPEIEPGSQEVIINVSINYEIR